MNERSSKHNFRKQIFSKIHLKCTFEVYMIEVMRFANSWFNSLIRLHHQKNDMCKKDKTAKNTNKIFYIYLNIP